MWMFRKMSVLLVLLLSALFSLTATFPQGVVDDAVTPQKESNDLGTVIFTDEPITDTPMTTPTGCEGLEKPDDEPCSVCQCVDWSGKWEWSCFKEYCIQMKQCEDSYMPEGQCCSVCPNGPNCEINGKIVPVDQTVLGENGDECVCQMKWGFTEVVCGATPSPPPTPEYPTREGTTIYIDRPITDTPMTTPTGCEGKEKPYDGPCAYCECADWSGRWEWVCYMADCWTACVDSYTPDGQCCPVCPNGPNCEINGEIVPLGETFYMPDGGMCYCEQPSYYGGQAEIMCVPPPPPSTPGGCEGQEKPVDGPCAYCECADWSGRSEWVCMIADCMVPQCMDSYTPDGQCCPVCPNGPNCAIGDIMIPIGDIHEMDNGDICYCDSKGESWEVPLAICEPQKTTPEVVMETRIPDLTTPPTLPPDVVEK